MKILLRTALLLFFILSSHTSALSWDSDRFLVLCYHDIPKNVNLNDYSVDQASFIDQIEYLSTHGYNFISLNDVIEANRGNRALPGGTYRPLPRLLLASDRLLEPPFAAG